jgi:hypothetical protein
MAILTARVQWFEYVSHLPPDQMKARARGPEAPTPRPGAFPPVGKVTRVSFAGWVDPAATTKLLNGTVLPTLVADWRGFYQWDLEVLLGPDRESWERDYPGVADFLERIYNEFRNVGISSQDRALNYSAMNAV